MNPKAENMVNKITEGTELNMLREENEVLKVKYKELQEKCENLEKKCMYLSTDNERGYMRGRIDGLEFSIRCNGVSGDSVKHA